MSHDRTLACVFAQRDDDAYGVALHANEPDFRFVLVHATFGELGDIRGGFPVTRDTLGSIRQSEDEAAWRALGRVPDHHECTPTTSRSVQPPTRRSRASVPRTGLQVAEGVGRLRIKPGRG